jgi:hypothetical protein
MAILLVVVLGFVLDSWHDPNGRWVGVVVTSMWALAFAGCAAAPGLAFWLRRHNARPSRVLLAVWAPALALTAICVVGFMIAPP